MKKIDGTLSITLTYTVIGLVGIAIGLYIRDYMVVGICTVCTLLIWAAYLGWARR